MKPMFIKPLLVAVVAASLAGCFSSDDDDMVDEPPVVEEPVNNAPVIADQSFSTKVGETLTGTIVASDADGDTLTYSVSMSASGTLTVDSATGAFTYTPDNSQNASDVFVVDVSDGTDTVNANISIAIDRQQAPVAANQSFSTQTDQPVMDSLQAQDVNNDNLSFALVTGPTLGSVSINADGSFVYTPALEVVGSDSFVFSVSDGTDTVNATANIAIDVLQLGFTSYARQAFAQAEGDAPLRINGRAFTDDSNAESFSDLLAQ